jgi:AcrR family transcriptional regulator
MRTRRPYQPRRRADSSQETRRRIVAAAHELLSEGAFHESTVEQMAARAGVARATLYQHFHSRLGVVDALCETFDENPALVALRRTIDEAGDDALETVLGHSVRFWASEEAVLQQLYGVAAVDPAAGDLVERQRNDRRGELRRLLRHLRQTGLLRPGLSDRVALAHLLVLTSFETFEELRRHAGFSEREVTRTLQETARTLLLP